MEKSLNKVFLLGRVGKDPVVHVPNTGALVNIRLATTKVVIDSGGSRYEKTEWHNVVGRGPHVDVFRDFVRKGSRILVEGELSTRSWGDETTGGTKYRTEVLVHELTLLSYPAALQETGGRVNGYSDRTLQSDAYFGHLPELTEQQVPY